MKSSLVEKLMHALSLTIRMEVIHNDATRKGKIGRMQEMITDDSLPKKPSKSGDIHHDKTYKYIRMYSSEVVNR